MLGSAFLSASMSKVAWVPLPDPALPKNTQVICFMPLVYPNQENKKAPRFARGFLFKI
jgi:hypothetical protein